MARETIVKLTDDIDGSDRDVSTVAFSWHGQAYEIDLKPSNAKAFDKAVRPYVDASRKVSAASTRTRRSSRSGGVTGTAKEELAAIRDWAKQAGYEIADRGRIASQIVEAYRTR